MVWGAFSGKGGGLLDYSSSKDESMNSDNYVKVLKDYMLLQFHVQHCTVFMHDSAPCHRTLHV